MCGFWICCGCEWGKDMLAGSFLVPGLRQGSLTAHKRERAAISGISQTLAESNPFWRSLQQE